MKKNKFSGEAKLKAVLKLLNGKENAVIAAREVGCHPTLLKKWKEKFLINDKQIRNSVFTRLYDYMYDVRKSVFKNKIQKSIKERWSKFLRLSLYLLDSNLKYPEIFDLTENELSSYLKKHKLLLPKNNLILAHEIIWEKVLKKNKII